MAQINIFIYYKKGFFFLILILVQVLSVQVLSLKHGKSLFRWEVQVHPHTTEPMISANEKIHGVNL